MNKIETMTINVPFAINRKHVAIAYNLQTILIYNNDKGLIAKIHKHMKTVWIDEKQTAGENYAHKIYTFFKDTPFDTEHFDIEDADFRSLDMRHDLNIVDHQFKTV